MIQFQRDQWALILGGSSGFGLATAKKLSRHGMSVCIAHRDRKGSMARIEEEFAQIRAHGHGFLALNVDALSADGRKSVLDALAEAMGSAGRIRLMMHSVAFGNLKPVAPPPPDGAAEGALAVLSQALNVEKGLLQEKVKTTFEQGAWPLHNLVPFKYGETLIGDEDMAMTVYSMGTSLLTWVQDAFSRKLFAADARVLSMTSEGNEVAWRGYAAVSAAKAALEAVSRSIALEFAPYGLRCNVIQAGVTDTPALRLIPGSDSMRAVASLRNPFKRMTRTEDVADFIALMCLDEAAWVNGAVLRVDGGERIASA